MKLLFIQGGSRIRINSKNEYYVDGNFNNEVFDDYYKLADSVTFVLRVDTNKYTDDFLEKKFNKLDSKFNIVLVDDIMGSLKKYFNIKSRKKIRSTIEREVIAADRIIIRHVGSYYSNECYKLCLKHKKQFLLEVPGPTFEGTWNHSLKGKFYALPQELRVKKAIKKSPYCVYVTEDALQKRYPCNGISLGCSDVRIFEYNDEKISNKVFDCTKKINIINIGFYDVKWKGQKDLIKAIKILKKEDPARDYNVSFVGSGNGLALKKLVKKLDLESNIKFLGSVQHHEIFNLLDNADLYVQTSYSEGLCRSIVEAMSRGLPVVCSDVGGNYELVSDKCLYPKKNVRCLVKSLKSIDDCFLNENSKINYEKSKKYASDVLSQKRDEFYLKFMNL